VIAEAATFRIDLFISGDDTLAVGCSLMAGVRGALAWLGWADAAGEGADVPWSAGLTAAAWKYAEAVLAHLPSDAKRRNRERKGKRKIGKEKKSGGTHVWRGMEGL
jgi:hypothetical protein